MEKPIIWDMPTPINLDRAPLPWFEKNGICHKSTLYKLRALGKIKFYYVLTSPWVRFEELYAAMTSEPETDKDVERMQAK